VRNEDGCLAPDELDAMAKWPASDRRIVHARNCPRCRALIEAHRLFHAPTPEELGAPHVEAADAALSAHLERIMQPAAPSPSTGNDSWWRLLFAPAMRPALAFAAITIVVGATVFVPRMLTRTSAPVLRGGSHAELVLQAPAIRADGALALRWQSVPQATHYRAVFYSTSLEELGHSGDLTGTQVVLMRTQLPAAARTGDLLIRIVAMRGGDELARSQAESLLR